MHILIVDDEPMMADFLVETIAETSPDHWIESAITEPEARLIAARMDAIDLLVTDVMLGETDGFALRETLLQQFPRMQTVFVTGHDLSGFGDAASGKKILRKPLSRGEIDAAIANAESIMSKASLPGAVFRPTHQEVGVPDVRDAVPAAAQRQRIDLSETFQLSPPEERTTAVADEGFLERQGFTGKLDQFQLVDIIQLCCLSGRTGRLSISKGLNSGVLFFSRNNIVHATCGEMHGEEAAFRIISWQSGSFHFAEGILPETESIHRSWENLMMEGAVSGDETGTADAATKKETGLLGQTLGAYHIVRKLGAGTWGDTYEARVAGSDDTVALKILSPGNALDPALVQEFIADANTKANGTHPHMLALPHGVAECGGIYFYPREYVDGESLDDYRVKGRAITERQGIDILKTVAETLLSLNQRKIPHSQIKASSIFVTRAGAIRLANLATLESKNPLAAQMEIRELSRIVSASMHGSVAASAPMRQLLTKMLVQSAAGIPSWGALLQAARACDTVGGRAVPMPVPAGGPRVAPTDPPSARRLPKPTILIGSAAALAVLLLVLLLFVF